MYRYIQYKFDNIHTQKIYLNEIIKKILKFFFHIMILLWTSNDKISLKFSYFFVFHKSFKWFASRVSIKVLWKIIYFELQWCAFIRIYLFNNKIYERKIGAKREKIFSILRSFQNFVWLWGSRFWKCT